jgi:hypothetical protein
MEVYAQPDMELGSVSIRSVGSGLGYSEQFENKENGKQQGPAIDNLPICITL